MADAWAAAARPKPDSWCRRALRLDRQFENSSARYDLSARPWYRDILRALTDPDVRSVTIMASTQVGKTLTLLSAILYCAEHDPAPAMVVFPDEASATEFRDRLYGNAASSIAAGGLKRVRIPKPWRWNRRYVDLGTCRVYLAWSQARQRLRGRPCRRVFCSEVDVWEGSKRAGDPVAQAHQRTKAFWRSLHYHESSPTEAPSQIADLEQAAAARYRWHAKCPVCGHEQELRFFTHTTGDHAGKGGIAGIKDESGELVSPDRARREAYYLCEAGCQIGADKKQQFITAGRWVALPSKEGERDRRTLGFHLWSAHAETRSWGDIAASYVEAHEAGKLRDWWGNELGLPYRPKKKVPVWYDVGTRLAGTHPKESVPSQTWFLTAGVDVQGDSSGCRYVVRGWGPEKTSWLVDWGWIERRDGDESSVVRPDLIEAGKQILERSFAVHAGQQTPLGRSSLRVRLACVDSGHQPKAVHDWMRSLPPEWVQGEGSERVRAVKGSHQLGGIRYKRSEVAANVRTGEAYEGGMSVWHLAVADHYPEFHERLFGDPSKPGAWLVTADCVTLGKAYLQQVCNLERRVEIDRNGRRKIVWAARDHRTPIDFADAEVYADFAAEMIVADMGWSAQAWEQWRQSRVKQQEARASAAIRPREREPAEDLSDR